MSRVTPLTRTTRPSPSTVGAAPPTHQRSSPPGRTTRNSASQASPVSRIRAAIPRSRSRSSGCSRRAIRSDVGTKPVGSTPQMRHWPSSQSQSPVARSQSHEPMPPAASARLRRCSLSRSSAVDASQLRRALGDAPLQLLVELLELRGSCGTARRTRATLARRISGHDRHRHVVDRAAARSPAAGRGRSGGRRDEDDRRSSGSADAGGSAPRARSRPCSGMLTSSRTTAISCFSRCSSASLRRAGLDQVLARARRGSPRS